MRAITDLLLSPAQHRDVVNVLERLAKLDSVTKSLQKNATTLLDTKTFFNSVITDLSSTASRIFSAVNIIHSIDYGSAICKTQDGKVNTFNEKELESVSLLAVEGRSSQDEEKDLTYAQIAIKKGRISGAERFMDTRFFFLPTFNLCEIFFSAVGLSLDNSRRNTLPANIEKQSFLYTN